MKADLYQLAGLAALVVAAFLFDRTVGIIALAVVGVVLLVSGFVEELNGSRTAPHENQSNGVPDDT